MRSRRANGRRDDGRRSSADRLVRRTAPAIDTLVAFTATHDVAATGLRCLSDAEQARAALFGSARRRQQFICGRHLLRRALEQATGLPAASHQLESAAGGKLECRGGPAVSLSHTGSLVACAVSSAARVGIDIEAPRPERRTGAIARHYFSAHETRWLDTVPAENFYALWTLKEAYAKSTGRGILSGMNRLVCTVTPPRIDVICDADEAGDLVLMRNDSHFLALVAPALDATALRFAQWPPDSRSPTAHEFTLLASSRAES